MSNHTHRSADAPTSGTNRLSEAEIRTARQALDAARERDRAAMDGGLVPIVEWVEVTRMEAAIAALEVCPHCHNEEPRPGGPYCDCSSGQYWLTRHKEFKARALRERDESRRRRLEQRFGHMEVPARYRGLSPDTLANLNGKRQAIAAAKHWMAGEGKPGLVVWGLPGVGKSVLGWWAVPQRGWGLWATWPEFYKSIQQGYGGGDARDKMRVAKAVPVLFLDDLGDPDRFWYDKEGKEHSRMATDDQRDILFELINHRCKEWLPLFITSNLNGAGLLAQFGDRIVSRLLELCDFVEMGGADLRRQR
jgi:DNA replication protein DnaC